MASKSENGISLVATTQRTRKRNCLSALRRVQSRLIRSENMTAARKNGKQPKTHQYQSTAKWRHAQRQSPPMVILGQKTHGFGCGSPTVFGAAVAMVLADNSHTVPCESITQFIQRVVSFLSAERAGAGRFPSRTPADCGVLGCPGA